MKHTYVGAIKTDTYTLIPFLVYVSMSIITTIPGRNRGGKVFSLHVTPWISICLSKRWRTQ